MSRDGSDGLQALRDCAAGRDVPPDLADYLENPYSTTALAENLVFPLADEPHIEAWSQYAEQAHDRGAIESLRERFVQLQFPIREGISQTEDYRAATRRGRFEAADGYAPGLLLAEPDRVSVAVHSTVAGHVPVVVAENRADFEALVQAFASRNEPERVPESMGACIVTGFNNWDRVHAYRRAWEQRQTDENDGRSWDEVFRQDVVPRKELYQDRFIILSTGSYSGCDAASLGIGHSEWTKSSLDIRREHEFTHYFTHRVFGRMRNHLLDEIVADFVGLVKTMGRFDRDLACRFLGLEDYPSYREGGRLQNYLGDPPVSTAAAEVLQCLSYRSIQRLGEFSDQHSETLADLGFLGSAIVALMRLGLESLASNHGLALLEGELEAALGSSSGES